MKPERKQLLKKTKLSKAVKEINSLELQEKAENRYAKLLAENTLIHPVLEKHLRQSILPAVAVYEVILSAGFSKEIAFQVIRSSVLEAARPMSKIFQTVGRLPFFFSLAGILLCVLTLIKDKFRHAKIMLIVFMIQFVSTYQMGFLTFNWK